MSRDALPSGTTIAGRYRVDRTIGRGGMGAVYSVRHLNTGETLALKVLNPALATNPQAVERFRTEARAPVRIQSEHVVRVIDADVSPELGGVPFMVMELLNGRDLGTELKRRGALPAGEVCLYLKQVARALDKAHALGIIHRDLKPANLYLTYREDGSPHVKILDFGIAKLADGTVGDLTQDGTIFGTPWYMSPEQARGQAGKVGPAADLWALGLIAYRLLTGQNYWTSDNMAELIGQILYEPMVQPSQRAPHLGPMFDLWFDRACNREVDKRFPNAGEQVNQLAVALGVSFAAQGTGMFGVSQGSQPSFERPLPGPIGVPTGTHPAMSHSAMVYGPPSAAALSVPTGTHPAHSSMGAPMQPMPMHAGNTGNGQPISSHTPSGAVLPVPMPTGPSSPDTQKGTAAGALAAAQVALPRKRGLSPAVVVSLVVVVLAGGVGGGYLMSRSYTPPSASPATTAVPELPPAPAETAAPVETAAPAETAAPTPPPAETVAPAETAAPAAPAETAPPAAAATPAETAAPPPATAKPPATSPPPPATAKPPPPATSKPPAAKPSGKPPAGGPKVDNISF